MNEPAQELVWLRRQAHPPLGQKEVHAWLADLRRNAEEIDAFKLLLSNEEQERASRFHFDKDRRRFTASRAILRELLARYLNAAAGAIRFHYNAHGKPEVAEPVSDFSFNVSHSGDYALYAFTRNRAVGIDVEQIRPDFATAEIAERFFSRNEVERFTGLPAEQQREAFFQCWTRKEAYIKAHGLGLALPLHSFAVAFGRGCSPALLSHERDQELPSAWKFWNLPAPVGYVGAVAVRGTDLRLRLFVWD